MERVPRRLVVMRHARAEHSAPTDHVRALADRGRSDAEAKLHRSGPDPRPNTASCEAIREPHQRSHELALPA